MLQFNRPSDNTEDEQRDETSENEYLEKHGENSINKRQHLDNTDEFDLPVAADEIMNGIGKSKKGKSSGPHRVKGEIMIKCASHLLVPYISIYSKPCSARVFFQLPRQDLFLYQYTKKGV